MPFGILIAACWVVVDARVWHLFQRVACYVHGCLPLSFTEIILQFGLCWWLVRMMTRGLELKRIRKKGELGKLFALRFLEVHSHKGVCYLELVTKHVAG